MRRHRASIYPTGVCHPASCHPCPWDLAASPACGMALAAMGHGEEETFLHPSGASQVSRQKDSHQGLLGKPSVLCLGWQQNPDSVEVGGKPRSETPPEPWGGALQLGT